jgi:hypothetical protein
MVGHGRASPVAEIKPQATLTGPYLQFTKGMKNGSVFPDELQGILRQLSGQEFLLL